MSHKISSFRKSLMRSRHLFKQFDQGIKHIWSMQVFPSAKYKLKYLTTWARLILEHTLVCWYSKARIFKNWFWKAKFTEDGEICERKFKPFFFKFWTETLGENFMLDDNFTIWREVSGNQFFLIWRFFRLNGN